MRRRSSSVLGTVLAGAAVLAAGCGVSRQIASSPPEIAAAPVADLSGDDPGLPRVFMGLAYGQIFPKDRTLASGPVYDLNLAWDVNSWLTTEFAVGLWNIGDRPSGVPGADSIFEMRPLLAMLQFTGEIPRLKSRLYLGAGLGYSQNSYDLGRNHESYYEIDIGTPDYDVTADDGLVMQYAVGWEAYSTADAELNLGIELRYVTGRVERVQWSQGAVTTAEDVDLEFYLLRFNVTWHF